MAFTGVLGSSDARLGNFNLAMLGGGSSSLNQSVSNSLTLTQNAVCSHTSNVAASNTLSLVGTATRITPITPIVGYTGGQTRQVYVKDITGNQELYLLNPDTQSHYPASTTKLMTALLIMENVTTLTNSVTLTTADVTDPFGGSSSAGFAAGDVTTWEGLLYAIFLPSAFEACQCAARLIGDMIYAAAGNTGTSGMTRFVEAMNAKASALGMSNTNYTDPVGGSQTTTTVRNVMSVRDCSTVCKEVFTYSTIRTIAGTPTYSLPITGGRTTTLSLVGYNRFINGPTNNQQGIKDSTVIGGKNGTWFDSGTGWHYNLSQIFTTPSGHEVLVTVYNAETLYALTLDVQGIMYSVLRDFPYLATPGYNPNDSLFSNVKMLVGGDGSIVDESNVARTLTPTSVTTGSPVIATTGALIYNARTDSVTAADATDLEFGSSDATVEVFWSGTGETAPPESAFFAKADHTGTPRREWVIEYDGSNHLGIFVNSSGTGWTNQANAFNLSNEERDTFFNGAPRHIALVKSGSTWSLYINGELGTSAVTGVSAALDTTVEVAIGYKYGTGFSALGSYDEFRLTNGNARYTNYKHTIDPRKFGRQAGGTVSAGNALVLTQTASPSLTYNRSISQTLTFTQEGARTEFGVASDTLTLTQTVAVQKVRYVNASSSLALTQAVDRSMTYNRIVNQGMILTQAATRTMSFYRSLTTPLVFSQNDIGIASKLASNTLALSQTLTYTYSHGARNDLTLTQVGDRSMTYGRSLHDFVGLFQGLFLNGFYNKAASNALSLTQQAVATNTKSVKQTVPLTDLATCTVSKSAFNSLDFTDAASVSHTANVTGTDALVLHDTLVMQKSTAVRAAHAFGMNQFARGTRVLHATASNTLVLQEALVQRYLNESVTQTLGLSQTVTCHKVSSPSVTQSLALTQAIVLSKTIVRSLTDTLVFKNSFQKYIGVADRPYVAVPVVQGVLIKKKCILTLEAPGQSIVLPCPQFNDGEAGTGRLNIKRAMDGTRRVYRRDSPTSKLKYDFVMDRKKAIELRNFVLNNNSNLLKMVNHKGEIWYVLLTNSPFTFTEQAFWDSSWGNKSTVTLELEGTRVN